MSSWLDKYREYEIEILYGDNSGLRDRGRLVDFGDGWIELYKAGYTGETFLVPTTAIRIVKILHGPADDTSPLLRPLHDLPPDQIEEESPSNEQRHF